MTIYVTGDPHGDFRQIADFCSAMETKSKDIMIVLGDAGLNYFGDTRDADRKEFISRTRITYLMVHGNHEMRPATLENYKLIEWNGGMVYQEEGFPNLLFAKDGEIYRLGGKNVMAIGGAYSVDKEYRMRMGYRWFADEQPSGEIKKYVEQQLDRAGWKVDPANTSRWSISCRGSTSPRWINQRKTGWMRLRTGWITKNGTAAIGISISRLIS